MRVATTSLLAQDEVLFLGEDFFPWMVLALGAAMVVGNVIALVRPPQPGTDGSDRAGATRRAAPASGQRPPMGRAVVMIVIGLVAAGWGVASLLS